MTKTKKKRKRLRNHRSISTLSSISSKNVQKKKNKKICKDKDDEKVNYVNGPVSVKSCPPGSFNGNGMNRGVFDGYDDLD